jgi:hypothetical protein
MFNHAALGGTFDHLHLGHKAIIDFALSNARKVTIAVATEHLHKNKEFSQTIEPSDYRKQALLAYLQLNNALDRVDFIVLNDIFGTTLSDTSFDSIVVTYETESNAIRINEERKKARLKPLAILTFPFVKGPVTNIIRSTDIRRGSINRIGLPYLSLLTSDILYLPKKLRNELRMPLAKPIFINNERDTALEAISILNKAKMLTIGVGDIVNKTLIDAGFTPDIQIIDFRTRRTVIQPDLNRKNYPHFPNKPGTLVRATIIELNSFIQKFLRTKNKSTMIIDGEEDLLTLPAILLAPLNSYIVYGQFDQGIVVLAITEDLKEKVSKIVNQFTTTPE